MSLDIFLVGKELEDCEIVVVGVVRVLPISVDHVALIKSAATRND